ncbi:hypothetical protein ACFFIS_09465 [Virgibacillus soli]|uniref:ABC transporter permease n=1 Tax=Paracerasibacillus soli TaxID=480284 RepID=A0ABU5CTI9_9BACI|nr:hypothetical protein [Virgibacillus soli]MDY0408745.1 hypothetical protein [Virgibacillus soli]
MSQSMKGLLWKEWRMMRSFFIGMIVLCTVLFIFMSMNSGVYESLVGMITLGLIIIPASLLFSLNMEVNNIQNFLHIPQPAHKLILAKILYSMFISILYMGFLIMLLTVMDAIYDNTVFTFTGAVLYYGYIFLSLIIISMFPAAILLFMWTVHQIWKKYIHTLSIVVILALLFIFGKFERFMSETAFYQTFTHWGKVSIAGLIPDGGGSRINGELVISNELLIFHNAYVGTFIFYGLIVIILYVFSIQLMERRVEG